MSIPILNETRFNQILEEWKNSNAQDNNRNLIESMDRIFRECYKQGNEMIELALPMEREAFITVQTLPQELFCYPPF